MSDAGILILNFQDKGMPPTRPVGQLAALCYEVSMFERTLPPSHARNAVGLLSWDTLDALEAAAAHVSAIEPALQQLAALMTKGATQPLDDSEISALRTCYQAAAATAFPISAAARAWHAQFAGLSRENSLSQMQPSRIEAMEVKAFGDPDLRDLLRDLFASLRKIKSIDDVKGFGQAFEFFGEALVYCLLSEKFRTKRVAASNTSRPDFQCFTSSGKPFYIELKSFDVVDGVYRATEMLHAGLDQAIDLERQIAGGASVAIAEAEVAPYRKAFDKPYPSDSLILVIDSLRDKARSAFKASQFTQGPTFAFALCDRVLLPAGAYAVVPYYEEPGAGFTLSSGVLWQACFGVEGAPIFRAVPVEGHPTLEGHLTEVGLLADKAVPFPTGAIFFAETSWSERRVLGLYRTDWDPAPGTWAESDTEEVMTALSTAFNDEANAWGFEVTGQRTRR